MLNNPKLDIVNISAYATFGQNLLKFFQDIERKQKCYGWTDGPPENSIPPIPHTLYLGSIMRLI